MAYATTHGKHGNGQACWNDDDDDDDDDDVDDDVLISVLKANKTTTAFDSID